MMKISSVLVLMSLSLLAAPAESVRLYKKMNGASGSDSTTAMVAEAEEEVKELKASLASAVATSTELAAALAAAQAEAAANAEAVEEVKEVKASLASAVATSTELAAALAAAQAEATTNAGAAEKVKQHEASLAEAGAELAALKAELEEVTVMQALMGQKESQTAEFAELQKRPEKAGQEKEELSMRKRDLEEENTKLLNEITKSVLQVRQADNEVTNLKADVKTEVSLSAELKKIDASPNKFEKLFLFRSVLATEKLEKMLDNKEAEKVELNKFQEAIKLQQQYITQIQRMNETIEHLRHQIAPYEAEDVTLKTVEAENLNTKQELQKLSSKIDLTMTEVRRFDATRNAVLKSVMDKKTKLDKIHAASRYLSDVNDIEAKGEFIKLSRGFIRITDAIDKEDKYHDIYELQQIQQDIDEAIKAEKRFVGTYEPSMIRSSEINSASAMSRMLNWIF